MRIVERASFSPGNCVLSGEAEGPFLDLECVMPQQDGRIYLRPGVVQMAAETCGLFNSYKEREELKDKEIAALKDEIAGLSKELDAYALIERSPRLPRIAERYVD